MHQLKVKFIRKSGNQYQFEINNRKVFIEDLLAKYDKYSSQITINCGSPGWYIGRVFLSLSQAEKAAGEQITSDQWFKDYMRSNPHKWGKSDYKNEYQITRGNVKIVDRLGEVHRVKNFENHEAKIDLLNLFTKDIRNLRNYFIEVCYN